MDEDTMEAAMLSALIHVDDRDVATLAGKAWLQMKMERDAAMSIARAICNEAGFDPAVWNLK